MASMLRAVEGVRLEDAARRMRDYERALKRHEALKEKQRSRPALPASPSYLDLLTHRDLAQRPRKPNEAATHVNVSFRDGKVARTCRLAEEKFLASKKTPVMIRRDTNPARAYWLFKRRLYRTSDLSLKPADVLALLVSAQSRRQVALSKAHAVQQMQESPDTGTRRTPIPREVKLEVWRRDGGRCVECSQKAELEFDHIIPLALGGSNSERNLQLLCGDCNRAKGASLG